MDRINKEHLERLKDSICTKTGIRHTLENMSGGWQLCRTMRVKNSEHSYNCWNQNRNNCQHHINVDGAEKVFNWKGYMPKRELYDLMQAYLEGTRPFWQVDTKRILYAPHNLNALGFRPLTEPIIK